MCSGSLGVWSGVTCEKFFPRREKRTRDEENNNGADPDIIVVSD